MSDLYLIHSAKGSQKADHKYISRKWNGKRWVYEYKQNASGNYRYDRYDYGKTKVSAIRNALNRSIEDKKTARTSDGIYFYPEKSVRNAAQDVIKNAKRLRDAKESTASYKIKTKVGQTIGKTKNATKLTKTTIQDAINTAKVKASEKKKNTVNAQDLLANTKPKTQTKTNYVRVYESDAYKKDKNRKSSINSKTAKSTATISPQDKSREAQKKYENKQAFDRKAEYIQENETAKTMNYGNPFKTRDMAREKHMASTNQKVASSNYMTEKRAEDKIRKTISNMPKSEALKQIKKWYPNLADESLETVYKRYTEK